MVSLRKIIDVHSHPILPFGQGAPIAPGKQPDWSVESALSYMDQHDISACVLSDPDAANHTTGQEARDIARRINETLADIVSKHPSRFGAVATLPGRDAGGAVAEIAYALDTLRMDGVSTSTSMIVNMVATGTKMRFSRIKIISTHGGGTIPYLVTRIQTLEHAFGVGPGRLELSPEQVREGIASFYYDLTAAASEAQLGAILKLVPISQLLMGLDFPFMPKSTFTPAIADIGRYAAFNEADLQSLSYGNAGRLYPALKARIERQR